MSNFLKAIRFVSIDYTVTLIDDEGCKNKALYEFEYRDKSYFRKI